MSKTQTIDASATTTAPPAAVFALLQDVRTWKDWGGWQETTYEREGTPAPHGPGAIRNLRRGRTLSREEVLVMEPGRLRYRLLSGLPVKGYESEVTLTETATGGTTIRWQSSFTAPPVVGTVMRSVLDRFIAQTVQQLGHAATTG